MRFSLLLFCTLAWQSVQALEIKLEECQKLNAAITDIEFLDDSEFLVTTKAGNLVLSQGCGKPTQIIQHFEVKDNSELGLLGVALGQKNEKSQDLYLYYSPKTKGKTFTRLSVFDFHASAAKPRLESEKILLEIDQPFDNHDGGALKIGPDGNLYLGVGDGGSGGDPHDNGQKAETLLGSILRIHPDRASDKGYSIPAGNLQQFVKGAAPEILAMGLRNPWKFAFDSKGNLIVADVGQNKIEEISIIPAESIGKLALNLGWRLKEGKACYLPAKDCDQSGLLDPVYQYGRDFGASITGGETLFFAGAEFYVFADYVSGALGLLNLRAPDKLVAEHKMRGSLWTTFGKSPDGEVYVANIAGDIYRLSLQE